MTQVESDTESYSGRAREAGLTPDQKKVDQAEIKRTYPGAQAPEPVTAVPTHGSYEALDLRSKTYVPAKEDFHRIMGLIAQWRSAQVGPVPVEMLQQAAKIITVYQRESHLMLAEYLSQIDRDLYLSRRMMLEKMEWEKKRFGEMRVMEEKVFAQAMREVEEEEIITQQLKEMKIKDSKA